MKFHTIQEAAEILRLASSTIYGLVHQRRITYRKHGSRVVFTEDDLNQFSKSSEIKALDIDSFREQNKYVKQYPSPEGAKCSLKTEYIAAERLSSKKEESKWP